MDISAIVSLILSSVVGVTGSSDELCISCKCSMINLLVSEEHPFAGNSDEENLNNKLRTWSPVVPVRDPRGEYLEVNCSRSGIADKWPPIEVVGVVGDFDDSGLHRFPDFPEMVQKKMFKLSLGRNRMEQLDSLDLHNYHDLRALDLSRNRIEYVADSSASLPGNLQRLDLSGNRIEHVGKFLKDSNLVYLDLSNNRISSLESEGVSGLKSLLFLDLSGNRLSTLSEDFRHSAVKLKVLQLAGNSLTEIPRLPRSVRTLNVSTNALQSVIIPSMDHLTTLDVSNNGLSELDNVYEQISLKVLRADRNRLSNVGRWKSSDLRVLDLSRNDFRAVPREISADVLPRLQELHLDGNPLADLSAEGRTPFPNLDILGLSGLDIKRINEESLKGFILESYINCSEESGVSIDLSRNNLKNIPVNTFKSFPVCSIDLSGNNLTSISSELFRWRNLRIANLQRNPWNCACDFQWILDDYLPHFYTTQPEILFDLRCSTPSRLNGKMMVYWYNAGTEAFCTGPSYYQYEYADGKYFEIWTVSMIICAILGALILIVTTVIIILLFTKKAKGATDSGAKKRRRSKPLFIEIRKNTDLKYNEISQDACV